MSTITLAAIDPVVNRGASLSEATRYAQVAQDRAGAFDAALSRQSGSPAQGNPQLLAQQGGAALLPDQNSPAAVQSPDTVDPRERARRALELDNPTSTETPTAGDMILNGIQKLRSTFDERQARVSEIMESKELDVSTLLSMQVEVVNYTMLIDITSKLTGKSTQSFDTLMKGQ